MNAIHVAVDLRILDRDGMERSGLGRYALESARALRAARPDWRLTIHSNRPDLVDQIPEVATRRTRWPTGSAPGRVAWLEAGAVDGRRPLPDLWLGPTFALPRRWRGPALVTIHDLVFLLKPELYRGRLNSWYAARAARRAAGRADRVLCGSTATRARIIRHLEVPAEKVIATAWGVADSFRNSGGTRDHEDYVLFVGRWEARKGLDVLHRALGEAARGGLPLRLVLAGAPGWRTRETIASLLDDFDVDVIRDPDDEQLAGLYSRALALVYPSRMEGFGLPVAEAMACGCPVITSDLPEIREWAGDAPLYVPAGDAGGVAEALIALAHDHERRARIAARGEAVAARLRWEAVGVATAEAIEAVLAERSAAG